MELSGLGKGVDLRCTIPPTHVLLTKRYVFQIELCGE